VILAGGLGRRIGGAKAVVELGGKPLISYPLEAMRAALDEVAVVAKPETELPDLPDGVLMWHEPAEPHHPLIGIVHALRAADGRSVLVCPADMPFVTPDVLRRLASARVDNGCLGPAPAVIAQGRGGGLQPQLGRYLPRAGELLARDAAEARVALRDAVAVIFPAVFKVKDERLLFNVNTPEDLAVAETLLAAESGP
jgi:molybdopterin-guanine dinucleotide biosynthesis protein A